MYYTINSFARPRSNCTKNQSAIRGRLFFGHSSPPNSLSSCRSRIADHLRSRSFSWLHPVAVFLTLSYLSINKNPGEGTPFPLTSSFVFTMPGEDAPPEVRLVANRIRAVFDEAAEYLASGEDSPAQEQAEPGSPEYDTEEDLTE